ncbi:MAG TPA: methyltransferase domain-containing protein [Pseudolabrys sp.]|nr:methyltransferase domain-containing protein [Pseudolabrys sp.]
MANLQTGPARAVSPPDYVSNSRKHSGCNQENQLWARIESLLTGSDSQIAIDILYSFQFGLSPTRTSIVDELTSLGMCTPVNGHRRYILTSFGAKCSASVREYVFWRMRDKTIHCENEHPSTRVEDFRGQRVLEVGCGCGMNLLRLSQFAARAIGAEVEPIYIQMSKILAKREALAPPEIYVCESEAMPFPAETFDRVIIFNSLQYMDVRRAFSECARVTRSGGMVMAAPCIIPSEFARNELRLFTNTLNFRRMLGAVLILSNTAAYQVFGRRLLRTPGNESTARPIRPTKRFLVSLAHKQGLSFLSSLSGQFGEHHCFAFEKVHRSTS